MEVKKLTRLLKENLATEPDDHRRLPARLPKATPFDLLLPSLPRLLRRPAFEQAIRKAALGSAPGILLYIFLRRPCWTIAPVPSTPGEIAFTFDNAEICDHYSGGTPEAFVLSKQISTAWVNFARTGNPNHDGLPHWPTYTAERRQPCI